MRKIIASALTLTLAAALSACGNNSTESAESAKASVEGLGSSVVDKIETKAAYAEHEAGLTEDITPENYDEMMGYTD